MIGFAAIAVASALWRPIGPYDTEGISAIAVNPRDRRASYIATGYPNGFTTGTAVYRTDDGGISWTERDLGLPRARDHDVRSLAVDPAGAVYAALTLNGVYRSNDEGMSWTLSLPTMTAWAVAADVVSGRVYASSAGDVYRLDPDSWTRIGSIGSANIRILITDPIDGRTVYAIGDDRVLYRSSDRGVSWKSVYSTREVTAMAIDDHAAVLIGTLDPHDFASPLLARSIDRGDTWSIVGGDLRPQVVPWNKPEALAFDAADIYLATRTMIFRSRDGGNSWSKMVDANESAEIGTLVTAERGVLLAGASSLEASAGILRKMRDDSWQFSNLGVHNVVVDSLLTSGPFIYAETDRAGADFVLQRYDGRAWQAMWLTQSVAPIRSAANRLYGQTSFGVLQLSYDNGMTWTPLATSGIDCREIEVLLVDPRNPQALYARAGYEVQARTTCAGLFRSNDGGTTWVHADVGLPVFTGTYVRPLGPMTISSSGTLVIDTNGADRSFAFERSSDGGVTWTSIAKPAVSSVADLAADVIDEKLLYALTDAGVYASANGGDSWQLALALPGTTTGNLMPASGRGHLFATDGKAVYETTDGAANWRRISDALPAAPIRKLALDAGGHLLVATDGSGVFLEIPARSRAIRK